jgi:glycosyltransferase involved in cell wall biosynthesis
MGRCNALNTGLEMSSGEWITYLDDDDIVYPTHLELLVTPMLDNSDINVTYTNSIKALSINQEGEDVIIARLPWPIFEFDCDSLLIENYIPIMAFMHRRSLVEQIGNFDEELDVLEDWDFLMRLSLKTNFYHVSRISNEYRFRVSSNLHNSITQNRRIAIETIKKLYARYPIQSEDGEEKRKVIIENMNYQVNQLQLIQDLNLGGLEKNLLTMAEISGFHPRFFRDLGFRA